MEMPMLEYEFGEDSRWVILPYVAVFGRSGEVAVDGLACVTLGNVTWRVALELHRGGVRSRASRARERRLDIPLLRIDQAELLREDLFEHLTARFESLLGKTGPRFPSDRRRRRLNKQHRVSQLFKAMMMVWN